MTRLQALQHLLFLKERDGLEFTVLDHGGYGTWPNVRVLLPSPCYGVIVRKTGWRRWQIDPRLAVAVARLCQWLHGKGVIAILRNRGGGFLGSNRWHSGHGRGHGFDLSDFVFESPIDGVTELSVSNTSLWPRYDHTTVGASTSPYTGTRRAGQAHELLLREGVPADEMEVMRDASLLHWCAGRGRDAPRPGLPFGRFITDLMNYVQEDFQTGDSVLDARALGAPPGRVDRFRKLVNPHYYSLGAPKKGRIGHQDHLHLGVPSLDPQLPHPEAPGGSTVGPAAAFD